MSAFALTIGILAGLLLLITVGAALFLLIRVQGSSVTGTDRKLQLLREEWGKTLDRNTQLTHEVVKDVARRVDAISGQVGQRLDNTSRVVGEVQKRLGELGQANQQIFEVGRHIASLQEQLRAPKFRGEFGEFLLENLLANVFPRKECYEIQHEFKSREKVDAVIRLGERLVPIDAKFPMESFKRHIEATAEAEKRAASREFATAVKRKIDDIAQKYILPDEGTYDFAMMYIPGENVYYEMITKDENFGEDKGLLNYALSKRVIPVSPNSFYAYLQVILFGLKGMEVEEKAQVILETLARLQGDLDRFREDFRILGKHLADARSSYESSEKRLEKFDEKLSRIEETEPKETLKIPERI